MPSLRSAKNSWCLGRSTAPTSTEGLHMARRHRPIPQTATVGILMLAGALLSAAAAQDIRGVEKCTAEAQMERRTGCLQANVEFLHQALMKLERDTREKINA